MYPVAIICIHQTFLCEFQPLQHVKSTEPDTTKGCQVEQWSWIGLPCYDITQVSNWKDKNWEYWVLIIEYWKPSPKKNPAYGRHWISRRVRVVAPIAKVLPPQQKITIIVICHVSRVMCHMSRITCHMSRVTCHMSKYFFFFTFFFFNSLKKFNKGLELVGGGSVINGAYPVKF